MVAIILSSCYKEVSPVDVTGSWKSLREVWTIIDKGEASEDMIDFGTAQTEESAVFRIYHSVFLYLLVRVLPPNRLFLVF